ncbi:MAG TPA: hypothetical protein DEB06_00515 [Phycisphaerales bacterium]|nr:hypothetical protein [Phycisphaerales bacterium]
MPRVEIAPGDWRTVRGLMGLHHYRHARPARVARVLVARDVGTGAVVGGLVVAMPTLNARWRGVAWPGRYEGLDARERAVRLNRDVRCIARVVVDPRWRGIGVATALVRAYLSDPLTPCTEAIAAMGRATRFFEHAGMTRHDIPPPARHARLLDALAHLGIEPWALARPGVALELAARRRSRGGAALLEQELRRWGLASRATRGVAGAPVAELFRVACRTAGVEQAAFTWGTAP